MIRATTRAQREAVWKLYEQTHPNYARYRMSSRTMRYFYRGFRKNFVNYGDYIGGQWKGMFVGIEKDGYTHT